MGIVFGAVVPHPPLMVPDIGQGRERDISATLEAMKQLASEIAPASPQVTLFISPHGPSLYEAMGIATAPTSRGNLRQWGARGADYSFPSDPELVRALQQEAREARIPLKSIGEGSYELDHGVLAPMFYLYKALKGLPLLPLTFSWLPLETHFAWGKAIRRAAERVGKRVVLVASGDLSHRLLPDAPAGYSPRGKEFDLAIKEALSHRDSKAILSLDPEFIEDAGECGLRSITILLGALEGLEATPKVLSYEGPFGVGYLVASFKVEEHSSHPVVRLARETVERYIKEGKVTPPPSPLAPELKEKAGVFVSIKKHGELRGCIGTFMPTMSNVAQEVIHNAIASATRDPRFEPIPEEELPYLSYSVDVLTSPEEVASLADLDAREYGVIVQCGARRGLLLPDLEGVNTPEEQVFICRRKGGGCPLEGRGGVSKELELCLHSPGLCPDQPARLFRFQVKRYT